MRTIARSIGKLAVALGLAMSLAGCFNAEVDIEILNATSARVTAVQTMNAEAYAMIDLQNKAADADHPAPHWFCSDGDLSTAPNGDALCTHETSGRFTQFMVDGTDTGLAFKRLGPDLVRVDIPTAAIRAELEAGQLPGTETDPMFAALFKDKGIAFTIGGGSIVASNLTIAADGMSATTKLKFTDVFAGKASIPDFYYAVVRLP